jgi:hypothetical protein
MKLAIWDPMTGRCKELQEPNCMVLDHEDGLVGAAVVCAISSCDHRACHEGPSQVVFFSLHYVNGARFVAQACVSFLEKTSDCSKPGSDVCRDEWSKPCSGLPIDTVGFIEPNPPVLVKDAIHLLLGYEYEYDDPYYYHISRVKILKYKLSTNCLSLIDAPSGADRHYGESVLMALEDGSLGIARIKRLHLYIWSRQMGSDGATAWTRSRVINLENIPTRNLLGSVEGSDIIFMYNEHHIYRINLKTLRRKKIWEGEYCIALIPYSSFYNHPGIYPHIFSPVL